MDSRLSPFLRAVAQRAASRWKPSPDRDPTHHQCPGCSAGTLRPSNSYRTLRCDDKHCNYFAPQCIECMVGYAVESNGGITCTSRSCNGPSDRCPKCGSILAQFHDKGGNSGGRYVACKEYKPSQPSGRRCPYRVRGPRVDLNPDCPRCEIRVLSPSRSRKSLLCDFCGYQAVECSGCRWGYAVRRLARVECTSPECDHPSKACPLCDNGVVQVVVVGEVDFVERCSEYRDERWPCSYQHHVGGS